MIRLAVPVAGAHNCVKRFAHDDPRRNYRRRPNYKKGAS
jgi:hypothetical protein